MRSRLEGRQLRVDVAVDSLRLLVDAVVHIEVVGDCATSRRAMSDRRLGMNTFFASRNADQVRAAPAAG